MPRSNVLLVAGALALPWGISIAQPAAGSTAVTPVLAFRVRPELCDWFRAADGDDGGRYAFAGVQARAGLAQQRPRWGWRAELQSAR